jgi:hypothetical protein
VVLNRKNSLFAGNPRGGRTAAILASLTSICRRHDVDPQFYQDLRKYWRTVGDAYSKKATYAERFSASSSASSIAGGRASPIRESRSPGASPARSWKSCTKCIWS